MKFVITEQGLRYIPKYVKQVSDMEFGSLVTHENYNEKLNLNTSQGDYNTEVLNNLFNETDPAKVVHIKYLDKLITDEVNRIDLVLADHQKQIDACELEIGDVKKEMSAFTKQLLDIINGVTQVGRAVQADKIAGIDKAGAQRYYGTNDKGTAGFYEMPESLFARDLAEGAVEIDGIYYTPRANSVTEDMLTEILRNKINRETLTDYNLLDNRPLINGKLLTGNLSLDALGIQAKGNYLTSVPSIYALKTDVTNAVKPYLLASTASSTYATKEGLSTLNSRIIDVSSRVDDNKNTAESRYARVCVNSFSGSPKNGDILITL